MPNVFDDAETFLNSSFARPVVDTLFATAGNRVLAAAQATVSGILDDEVKNGEPGRTQQQVMNDMDGRVWHNARHLIGGLVDVIRSEPSVDTPLRDLINLAVSNAVLAGGPAAAYFAASAAGEKTGL